MRVQRIFSVVIVSTILLLQTTTFGVFTNPAFAEDVFTLENFVIPGRVTGTGTHFEVTDSQYLNVTLDSTEPINLVLESIPEMITMNISQNSTATSTDITMSGFAPDTTYHKYEDNYHNHVPFTTDSTGSYTYTQDLSSEHFVFIQPMPSTKFIVDDGVGGTGGDCSSIGIWDGNTKTCTLTGPVNQSIQIDSNGITLDGGGNTVTGPLFGFGVLISGKTNVTIKNLNIEKFATGIIISSSNDNTLTINTISNNGRGILIARSSGNILTDNNVLNNFGVGIEFGSGSIQNTLMGNSANSNGLFGIQINDSIFNTVTGNTASSNTVAGIVINSGNNAITSNTVNSNAFAGIFLSRSIGNTLTENIVEANENGIIISSFARNSIISGNIISSADGTGLILFSTTRTNQIFNNFFTNNPIHAEDFGFDNIFNLAAPTGGNTWDTFDEPSEGCFDANSDGFCDAPFVFNFNQDNLPFCTVCGPPNLPPIADSNGPYLSAIGTPVTLDSTDSSDPDVGDTLSFGWSTTSSCTFDDATLANPQITCPETGIFDVTLQVTDSFGESDTDTTSIVVYDPSGGFVTGGGWIESPAGAYVADPSMTGKANFGFVSKYQKGSTIPTGETEFQFKVANLNFHSDSYDWLVIAGHKAIYKGVGTINGAGNYGFMLFAIDEKLTPSTDTDLFRIQILDKDAGDAVVYNNEIGGADDADPTTEISGGQIVIQKGK